MNRRLISGAFCSLVVAGCAVGAGFCKAPVKKVVKPASKIAPKKAPVKEAPATWVTKTVGNITCSVLSNWKRPSSAPAELCAFYTGTNEDKPAGAFACMMQYVPDMTTPPGVVKTGKAKLAGMDATEYTVKDKDSGFEGLMLLVEKADANGTSLMVMAGSLTGQWAKYEADLRKMIDSVKINTPPAPAAESKGE